MKVGISSRSAASSYVLLDLITPHMLRSHNAITGEISSMYIYVYLSTVLYGQGIMCWSGIVNNFYIREEVTVTPYRLALIVILL